MNGSYLAHHINDDDSSVSKKKTPYFLRSCSRCAQILYARWPCD